MLLPSFLVGRGEEAVTRTAPCRARVNLRAWCAIAVGATLLIGRPVRAEEPWARWQTLETPHFRVHYPAGFEAWARRAAGAMESIRTEVTRHVGFTPATRLDVVIEDPLAVSNGFAIPAVDRPVIIVWTSPPTSDSPIGSFVDWPQLVLTHEFCHVAHLTRPRSHPWNILRYVTPVPYGPLSLWTPRWLKEGYATTVEGAITGLGRPSSSLRAMVLRRLAIAGKLPEYRQLNATRGWLASSMAYLAGSAFLEWLTRHGGEDSLRQLWTDMTSRKPIFFTTAFRKVYGQSPRDMYDRFRAELTAAALAEEKRLQDAGLVHGELWRHFDGGVSAPQVSPSGTRLLARREPNRGDPYLAVWAIGEPDGKRKAQWRLPAINGSAPAYPRWMPDGQRVLFSYRTPDRDGVLHWDLSLWQPDTGAVRRVTRLADVLMADPLPDGRRAIAVRMRHGSTELVFVELESGTVTTLAAADEQIVWNYPRVSPDGTTILALAHRDARWRLVGMSSSGHDVVEIAINGQAIGPPAWAADSSRIYFATDASGIWNIHSTRLGEHGSDRLLTRVTGGTAAPAPAPDGRWIFFLELTAKGVDIRRAPAGQTVTASAAPTDHQSPVLPPASPTPVRLPTEAAPAAKAYRPWSSMVARPLFGSTSGPDRGTRQVGLQVTDVLGRVNWLGVGSFVRESKTPRSRERDLVFEGAATTIAYRGLPVALTTQAFAARERPGRQTLVSRPEFDRKRVGVAVSASWRAVMPSGALSIDAGGGVSSNESLSDGRTFRRALVIGGIQGAWRRTRGASGIESAFTVHGAAGRTAGGDWRQALARLQVGARTPVGRLELSGRYGDTAGSPTLFDLFAVGGSPSTLVPQVFDLNRAYEFGLPPFLQVGRRMAGARAQYVMPGVPLAVYVGRLSAWNPGAPRPPLAQAAGVELRFEDLGLRSTLHMPGAVSFYIGRAAIRSDQPAVRATRTYTGLVYRP